METGSLTPAISAALTKKAQLSSHEIEQRLAAALDLSAWRSLVTFATIGAELYDIGTEEISGSSAEREFRRLGTDGYFYFQGLFHRSRVARMYRTIEILRASGWPAVFAFVFDDFWSITRTAPVVALLERFLGVGYRQNSNLWAYWVNASVGASGWPPHIDRELDPRKFLNLWIALTDATIDNGCIFVVPRTATSDETIGSFLALRPLPSSSYRTLLQRTVPLPGPAGTLIGWHGDIIHWGGHNHGGAVPRVSLAIEFRAADSKMADGERPLFDVHGPLPTFRERLFAIANSIRGYTMQPLTSTFRPVADQLFALTKSSK